MAILLPVQDNFRKTRGCFVYGLTGRVKQESMGANSELELKFIRSGFRLLGALNNQVNMFTFGI